MNDLRIAAALAACVAVAGCKGGDDDRGDDGKLGSPAKVAARLAVGSLAEVLAPAPPSARKSEGTRAPATLERAMAKAAVACQGGGTRDTSAPFVQDVNSPFTNEDFLLEETLFNQCRTDFSDGSSLLEDGFELAGCALSDSPGNAPCSGTDDLQVSFLQLGTPQETFITITDFVNEFGSEVTYDYDVVAVQHRSRLRNADGVAGRTRVESRYSANASGVVVNDGSSRAASLAFGRPGQPTIRVTRTEPDEPTLMTFDGYNSLNAPGCDLGEFRLRTVIPLEFLEDAGGTTTDLIAGRVEITQDGEVAIAEVLSNGALRIVDADGDAQVYTSAAQLRNGLGACYDFAVQ